MGFLAKVRLKGNQLLLKANEHSPEILFGTGLVLMAYTIYSSNKKSMQIEPIKMKHKANMDTIFENEKKASEDPEHYEYSEKQKSRDLYTAYKSYGWDLLKHYGVPIATGVLAVTCELAAFNILNKRYVHSMAVTAGLEEMIRNYRANVIADQGIEADKKYMYGLQKETVKDPDITVKKEDGTEVPLEHEVATANNMSAYSRVFYECNKNFDPRNPEGNKDFILAVQDRANFELNKRGYLFLNEVYRWLGFDETEAGTRVGWLKDGNGDGYVSFDIMNIVGHPNNKDFINLNAYSNGDAPEVLLDFNVDGDIIVALKKRNWMRSI